MFSLRTLLLAVAVAAIGTVGLTTRNLWWASVFSSMTAVAILASLLFGIFHRGQSRWFAIGFVICAGLYLRLISTAEFEAFSSNLLTTRLLGASWRAIEVPRPNPPADSSPYVTIDPGNEGADVENYAMTPYLLLGNSLEMLEYNRQLRSFFVVGQCLWALFLGFLGGLFAGYLTRDRPIRDASPAGMTGAI